MKTTHPAVHAAARVLLVASLLSPLAHADGDHDRARTALQAGQVLPLKTVLEMLERVQAGQVMEVELEQENGRWLYEVKLLKPGGQLVKLKLDARNGELLSQSSKSGRRLEPDAATHR